MTNCYSSAISGDDGKVRRALRERRERPEAALLEAGVRRVRAERGEDEGGPAGGRDEVLQAIE